MSDIRRWTWQTWAILFCTVGVMVGWVSDVIRLADDRDELRAKLTLPKTADLFHVSYVRLARGADGHLVVYTDAYARTQFEGRFRVSLRDMETGRHEWTPEWSDWITYNGNSGLTGGVRYRQPETLQWWADREEYFEPPQRAWIMETCWQARIESPVLGLTELEPVCAISQLEKDAK